MPEMTRTIVQFYPPRGAKYAPCSKGIHAGFKQFAPCNTHLCPRQLSYFNRWSRCFYNEPNIGVASGCYKMRILPMTDAFIKLDVVDLIRNCSKEECIEYLP
ncbi:unnamed protein product [Toxocara canis]|uniref:Fibronectin type-II domain-containing protein n=2 Tax=Toxocara canis TaxID=6265 RepID=A0A183VGK3_TOXCA|nr:unnamed protein product [Toxocara canis]